MASPRWRKSLADLKLSRSRTILVVLSIAIGVFAVGAMLTSQAVLQRGFDEALDTANPASAVIMTEPFDQQLVDQVLALPEVGDAEGRTHIATQVQDSDGAWRSLDLRAISDFDAISVDRLEPEDGAWPPATGEVLLERLSLKDAGLSIGDRVTIALPDGTQYTLPVAGTVYDPGQVHPSMADDRLNAYVTLETLETIGQPAAFNELHVVASENPRDLKQGERTAALVRDQVLTPNDVVTHRIAVQDTPRYHGQALGDAIIMIFSLLGMFILLLGAFLVINTVSAILAQQVRQIGVMKAIGGQRRQIAGIYFALVLGYGLLAVAVALPLAVLAAWFMTGYLADMLNINADGPWLPSLVVALELALALLVPLLAALVPVLRGTRITVREAVTSYGLSGNDRPGGLLDRLLASLRGFSRPVLLSLRNTFRRRGRLALTLATLTIGGALFASFTTIQSSLDGTFDEMMDYWSYDVQVNLDEWAPAEVAVQAVEAQSGITAAEGWIATNASYLRPDGSQNSNVWFTAAPADTALIQPTLVEGRWLLPDGGQALVVNVDIANDEGISVGDIVSLAVEGQTLRWPVVGISTSQLIGPAVYAPYQPFSEAVGLAGMANRIIVQTERHDVAAQEDVARLAEDGLRVAGVPVAQVDIVTEMRGGTESVFSMLVVLLLVISILLVIVGSIGLTGAMSLNVIERTREIGVMRAIGATNGAIARILIVEGLTVGLLSWLLGAILAIPLSWGLAYALGVALVQSPLVFTFSYLGLGLWLVVVVVLSVVASILPARRAWRLSIREVLAYE